MRVQIFEYEVDIGQVTFGSEIDRQIRDQLEKLDPFYTKSKKPIPKRDEKVKAIVENIRRLAKLKEEKHG